MSRGGFRHEALGVRKFFGLRLSTVLAIIIMLACTSCVHEWPEAAGTRTVRIDVSHTLDISYIDHIVKMRSGETQTKTRTETRGDGADSRSDGVPADREAFAARYIYKVYPKGDTRYCVWETTEYREDLALKDFTTELTLPVGDWDIYVWNDFVDLDTRHNYFYDATEFTTVGYGEPFVGCHERKESFRGQLTVSVPASIEENVSVSGSVCLERPLAAYAFVATDLEEFIVTETTRQEALAAAAAKAAQGDNADENATKGESGGDTKGDKPMDAPANLPDYGNYTVTFRYAGFLPAVFNNLTNKPVDSRTGVSYTAKISQLSDSEALLGYDHFFVNGHESSVKVAIEVRDTRGNLVANVNPIDIPVKRGRCTVVRGEFLTSRTTGGVGIVPDFDGEYNIEIF